MIPIHALREEGDRPVTDDPHPTENFYPRPPRGGRRNAGLVSMIVPVFLSPPSARRATTPFGASSDGLFQFLSTPSVRRATVPKFSRLFWICYFYPRPPRGGRPKNPFRNNKSTHFCPRPPRGGRRRRRCRPQSWIYFYPRPPRGGRQAIKVTSGYRCVFLSTPSARRATRPALCL